MCFIPLPNAVYSHLADRTWRQCIGEICNDDSWTGFCMILLLLIICIWLCCKNKLKIQWKCRKYTLQIVRCTCRVLHRSSFSQFSAKSTADWKILKMWEWVLSRTTAGIFQVPGCLYPLLHSSEDLILYFWGGEGGVEDARISGGHRFWLGTKVIQTVDHCCFNQAKLSNVKNTVISHTDPSEESTIIQLPTQILLFFFSFPPWLTAIFALKGCICRTEIELHCTRGQF